MKNYLKYFSFLIVTVILALIFSKWVGNSYNNLTHQTGTFIDLSGLIGFPLIYIFILTLLFSAFGDSKKYWWIGVLLIPAVVFELYFDWQHIYIPIVLGLVGWVGGYLISKAVAKR